MTSYLPKIGVLTPNPSWLRHCTRFKMKLANKNSIKANELTTKTRVLRRGTRTLWLVAMLL